MLFVLRGRLLMLALRSLLRGIVAICRLCSILALLLLTSGSLALLRLMRRHGVALVRGFLALRATCVVGVACP